MAENDEESVATFAEKLNMKDACYMLDCMTSVQEEFEPVDDETDEDEDNNNNNSKGPSNADAL
ncbi:UNVERIFIED_CONTAM: hypothetical protein NCL1_28264 [Trichonephila clavipes]